MDIFALPASAVPRPPPLLPPGLPRLLESPGASSVSTGATTSPAFSACTPSATTPVLLPDKDHHHHRRASSGFSSGSTAIGESHHPQKHALYKTELCRSWEESGRCRYGARCQFAHGHAELRPVQRHPKYKTEVCRTWMEKGECPYGRRCCFIHGDDTVGSARVEGLRGATGVTFTPPGQKPAEVIVPLGTPPTIATPATPAATPDADVEGVTRLLGRALLNEVLDVTTPQETPTGRVYFGNREVAPRVRSSTITATPRPPLTPYPRRIINVAEPSTPPATVQLPHPPRRKRSVSDARDLPALAAARHLVHARGGSVPWTLSPDDDSRLPVFRHFA